MKKIVLLVVLVLMVVFSSFAADKGDLTVGGWINEIFSLTLPANFTNGQCEDIKQLTTWTIGDLTVISNASSWSMIIASVNGGFLKNGSTEISYTLYVGDITPKSGITLSKELGASWTSFPFGPTTTQGVMHAIAIEFGGPDVLQVVPAGYYSDTIQFSIKRN